MGSNRHARFEELSPRIVRADWRSVIGDFDLFLAMLRQASLPPGTPLALVAHHTISGLALVHTNFVSAGFCVRDEAGVEIFEWEQQVDGVAEAAQLEAVACLGRLEREAEELGLLVVRVHPRHLFALTANPRPAARQWCEGAQASEERGGDGR